jgi:cell volume regulation protein A
VPIVLATFPLQAGLEGADTLFNVVFFVVLVSVLVQGTTIPVVARWLGVLGPPPAEAAYPIESVAHPHAGAALHGVDVAAGSRAEGRRVFELGLPEDVLIVLIDREGVVIVPRGETVVVVGDRLMVLANLDDLAVVRAAVAPH